MDPLRLYGSPRLHGLVAMVSGRFDVATFGAYSRPMIRISTFRISPATALAVPLLALLLGNPVAFAQERAGDGPGKPAPPGSTELPDHPDTSRPDTSQRAKPEAPAAKPRPILPQARSDGARPLERVPQTAAEKARALSDLYAQLATAADEKAAQTFAGAIERLWQISGSDTTNLLVGRAAKAIAQDRFELAGKLLDSAVALSPDYAEVFNQRAFLRFKQGDYRSAVGDLRRVLALEPNHYKALEGLAQIWRETGNKKSAYEVMKHLLAVHPFASGAQRVVDELKREVEGADL